LNRSRRRLDTATMPEEQWADAPRQPSSWKDVLGDIDHAADALSERDREVLDVYDRIRELELELCILQARREGKAS
jgi:hypothetical protein